MSEPSTVADKAAGFPAPGLDEPAPKKSGAPLVKNLLRIVFTAVITVAVLTLITFFGTNLRSPEKSAIAALGHEANQAQIDAYIAENRLDEPVLVRYFDWISGVLHGDLGVSSVSGIGVSELLGERFVLTLNLAAMALAFSLVIAVPLGMYMARRMGSTIDTGLMTGSVALAALPEFVVGILLAYFLAAQLGWFPITSSGLVVGDTSPLASYVLPVLTLSSSVIPYIARLTRAGMRDALDTEAVRSATLRGLPASRVQVNHALRLAAVPIISSVAISTTYLLGSVLVVEQVFGFPGLGQLTVSAVSQGDTPVLQACALVLGAMIVTLNLIFEVLALQFNPKMKVASR